MCNHHNKYVHLNVDLSKFKITYCDNQSIIFNHIDDTDMEDRIRDSYVVIYSDSAWMGGNIGVNLYLDGFTQGSDLQLDQALLELDKHFINKK